MRLGSHESKMWIYLLNKGIKIQRELFFIDIDKSTIIISVLLRNLPYVLHHCSQITYRPSGPDNTITEALIAVIRIMITLIKMYTL